MLIRSLLLTSLLFVSFQLLSHTAELTEPSAEKAGGLNHPAALALRDFQLALKNGDADAVLAQLADDVLILEGKGVERSKQQYASHHLQADIKYLQHIKTALLEQKLITSDEIVVSISRRQFTGTFKDKVIDRTGNETITLQLVDGRWLITHIHWSH